MGKVSHHWSSLLLTFGNSSTLNAIFNLINDSSKLHCCQIFSFSLVKLGTLHLSGPKSLLLPWQSWQIDINQMHEKMVNLINIALTLPAIYCHCTIEIRVHFYYQMLSHKPQSQFSWFCQIFSETEIFEALYQRKKQNSSATL